MSAAKPPDKRQRRRPAGQDVKTTKLALVPPRMVVPDPPKGLLKATRKAWDAYWASDISRLATPETMPALTRLFLLYDDRARAHEVARKEMLVKGSKGQPRLSPAWPLLHSLDSEICSLEDRFGLTPHARLKVGAEIGGLAKSLEAINEQFRTDEEPEEDPRLALMEQSSQDV